MSLKRQLFLLMLVVFAALMTAVFSVQFNTTLNFLKQQQATQLNNAVTSVSMALSPYLEKDDMVSAQTVVRATFDNSVYQSVSLRNLKNGHVFTQTYTPTQKNNVPVWFTKLVQIHPIKRQTIITSGWLQLGKLTVISSPMNAYYQFWISTWQTLLFFGVLFLIALLVSLWWLSNAFKPLKEIQHYASQLANSKFDAEMPITPTLEFTSLIKAFHNMAQQLKQHFQQQADEAEKLRIRAYQDPVSNLANREYSLTQLHSWLQSQAQGGLILLKAAYICEQFQAGQYQIAEEQVKQLAKRLQGLPQTDTIIGRLNQAEFLLIVSDVDAQELKQLAHRILNVTDDLQGNPFDNINHQACLGLIMHNDAQSTNEALTKLDNAITECGNQPHDPVVFYQKAHNARALGKQEWKQLILEAIANKRFRFKKQNAIDVDNQVIHEELFSYIQNGQTTYTANQFLFMAEKLDIGAQLDMHIIENAINEIQQNAFSAPVAINITQSAIQNIGFLRWLNGKMKALPTLSNKLIFELPENAFIKEVDNTALLCEMITQNGFTFGIDRFGHNFSAMGYLNQFHPAYVKLDFAYTQNLHNEKQLDALNALVQFAHNLNIQTIASRVETLEQKATLAQWHLDGFQGYVVDTLEKEIQE